MQEPDFLSVLASRFSDFLVFRELGGLDSKNQIPLLRHFDRFLVHEDFQGRWPIRELLERYAASGKHLQPGTHENRICVVRQFCSYLRTFEPECFVPEPGFARRRRTHRLPHIYTKEEIQAVLRAARDLPSGGSIRSKTYYTLFGLLYSTGLRCGEAFGLHLTDVDLAQRLLFIRHGKFRKSRWVPIAASTAAVLQSYLQERMRVAPSAPESPFLVTSHGERLYHSNADFAFRWVLKHCGLRGGKGCPGPRLHHLRHSFACTRLLAWYHEGRDVQALLPTLATYMGHVSFTSTQVYLHATAELLAEANHRFLENFRHNIFTKGEKK
jgi:integrase/recombinase XerD